MTSLNYIRVCFVCAFGLFGSNAFGHGGVYLEEDMCVIKIGFYEAHFTIFQPGTRGHEQYCEDVPDVTESVFVLEYLHNGLESMPVDFRIVQNTTKMGLFASWEDIERIDNLDAITVFYQPAQREPDVYAVIHTFTDPGQFIGIVTGTHPETDTLYTAVFPFEVGFAGINYLAIGAGLVFITLALWISTLLRGMWRNRALAHSASMFGLLIALLFSWPATAISQDSPRNPETTGEGAYYQVTATSQLSPLRINQMHAWTLVVTDKQGRTVNDAAITVDGGMPLHNHGLATAPQVTQTLGDGGYLVEGMKFHMRGYWEINVTIRDDDTTDIVTLKIDL